MKQLAVKWGGKTKCDMIEDKCVKTHKKVKEQSATNVAMCQCKV